MSFRNFNAALALALLLAACGGGGEDDPAPEVVEAYVEKIEAEQKAERNDLIAAARAREEERARRSEERLRQLERAPPAALEGAARAAEK